MSTRYLTYLCILMLTLASGYASRASATGRIFSDPVFTSDAFEGFCRDNDGYLWIATGSGLFKFDGNNYQLYRHDEDDPHSLSDSRLHMVFCDSKGRIWAATSNGLNLYDRFTDSFERIILPSMSYAGYIMDVIEQGDGTITFNVAGKGMFVVDDSKGKLDAVRYMPDFNPEIGQLCYHDDIIYISTYLGEVYAMKPNGKTQRIRVADGYITDLIPESDGNILVGSVKDIYRIYPNEGHRVERIETPDNTRMSINNFTRGRNGKVYFSTATSGLWKICPGGKSAIPCTNVYLPTLDIWNAKLGAVYADNEGNIWLGCQYKGLACIPYNSIPFSYRLLSDVMPGFKGGIDGFAVSGNKIAMGYGNKIGVMTSDGKLVADREIPARGSVNTIIPAGKDRLLIGVTNDGIWEMTLDGNRLSRLIDYPGKYPTIEMCRLPGGELLIGYHGVGLVRYNPRTKAEHRYEHNPESGRLSNPFFSSMKVTPDSAGVWIGLYGGISYLDLKTDTFRQLNQSPFLQGATYALQPLSDGSVLAGTSHGLIHYDLTGKVRLKYTTANGLTDNDIRSIIMDKKGGFWIGTKRGLNYLPSVGDKIVVYHGGYGLQENVFPYGGMLPDNRIILGSNLGVMMFNPDSILAVGFGGKVHASSILLNGSRLNRSTKIDGKPVMSDTDPLSLNLPYKDNSLTVKLSTLDFRDAANVRYMWMIEGISDEWRTTGPGENVIYLPHLDPGTYCLRLKAIDNDVISGESVINIIISTPWYMSGAAKMLYAVVLVSLVLLSVIVIKKKREEKISETKIRFFIDVSHDIRSPITLILTPLESLLKEPFPPEVTAKLRVMYRNGQRILSLVNQLLDLRKIDKGGMRLLCRPTNLSKFIAELVDMFTPQAADKKLSLAFRDEGGIEEKAWIDRDNFDKILVNIISNAIKYTPEGGNIEVVLKGVDDDTLGPCAEVKVIDSGIGFGNTPPEQLFVRFYRAREGHSGGIGGVGIGLDLCHQLIKLHHGTITAQNRTDGTRGAIFTVRIPLNESAYAASELMDRTPADNSDDADKHLVINEMQPAVPTVAGKPKRKRLSAPRSILIVDDDAELRDYISQHLGELGYKTLTADNGQEALKIVGEGNIDLVVSDVKMPVMDGLTFIRHMRSNVGTHHIPVIILSSKNDIADRIEGWDRGTDGYLGKPFNINELDTMIDNIIETRLKLKGKFSGAQDTDAKIDPPEIKGYDEALMEKIIKTINEHIDNPELNVEMLGQSIGISRVQLYRKLKEMIGMTPSDFIRNIRLKRACLLLQKPDLDVTQVAYAVGFSSQPHFSTAFKRYTGFSPTEYKQRCMRGDIPPSPDDKTQPDTNI